MTDDLEQIPGVGPAIARELRSIGIAKVRDLVDRDPECLYRQLCDRRGAHVDRCVLYVFRCAVYCATATDHDPELLKWWNWKDDNADNWQLQGRCGAAHIPDSRRSTRQIQ